MLRRIFRGIGGKITKAGRIPGQKGEKFGGGTEKTGRGRREVQGG